MPSKLTNTIIEAAIAGFEAQKEKINAQIAELKALRSGDGSSAPSPATEPKSGTKRKFSAAALKNMRKAQQLRWAKAKGAPTAPVTKTAKPKRKLSAAGRANIIAALKKRWAAKKAAARK